MFQLVSDTLKKNLILYWQPYSFQVLLTILHIAEFRNVGSINVLLYASIFLAIACSAKHLKLLNRKQLRINLPYWWIVVVMQVWTWLFLAIMLYTLWVSCFQKLLDCLTFQSWTLSVP